MQNLYEETIAHPIIYICILKQNLKFDATLLLVKLRFTRGHTEKNL